MGWVAWEGDEGGGGVGACVGRCGIGCPRELGFWHFIFQFWHFLLRTAPVLISIERYSALHHPGFHRGPEYRVLIYTCDCGLCLVRLSARKPWSRGARAVTRCTRRRAAAAATTTRAPTAAMATMAAPVSCAAGPAARSASASTHPPRPPSRSYRPQLPSSATVLSYRPQLPPSATALSYRPQLPPSATALSYRPQLPPLRLSCKPMHAPPAGARGGRPGLPARSAAHPVLGDCRGDEPLPKGSPRRGWGVRRDAPAIR
jgi:hypothetical protein